MKLNLKSGEHLRIEHDHGLGFVLYVVDGVLHVKAKDEGQGDIRCTTLVVDGKVEVVK